MRLGKEQATGYVEDTDYAEETGHPRSTGAEALLEQEVATAQPDGLPPVTVTEPSLTPH